MLQKVNLEFLVNDEKFLYLYTLGAKTLWRVKLSDNQPDPRFGLIRFSSNEEFCKSKNAYGETWLLYESDTDFGETVPYSNVF